MFWTLFARYYLLPSVVIAFFLTVLGCLFRYWVSGDDISEPSQTVLISLTTTLYAYIVGVIVKLAHGTHKYSRLAGSYTGYAYQDEVDVGSSGFYKLEAESQSVATLKYVGGVDFSIKIDVSDHPSKEDLTWSGDFTMVSEHMAKVAWWYTNEGLEYSVGHKKAVVKDDVIILFSDDSSIHRREVFIKDKAITRSAGDELSSRDDIK